MAIEGIKVSALPEIDPEKLNKAFVLSYLEEMPKRNYRAGYEQIRDKVAEEIIDQEYNPTSNKAQSGKAVNEGINQLREETNAKLAEKVDKTEFNSKVQELEDDITSINDELNSVNEKLDTKVDKDTFNNTVDSIEGKIQDLSDVVDTKVDQTDFDNKIEEIENNISSIQDELETKAAQSDLEGLQTEYDSFKEQYERDLEDLNQLVDDNKYELPSHVVTGSFEAIGYTEVVWTEDSTSNLNLGADTVISDGKQSGILSLGPSTILTGGIQTGVTLLGSESLIGVANYGNVIAGTNTSVSANESRNLWVLASYNEAQPFNYQCPAQYGLTLIGTGENTPSSDNEHRFHTYWPNSEDYPAQIHGFTQWTTDHNILDKDGQYIVKDGSFVGSLENNGSSGDDTNYYDGPNIVICESEDDLPSIYDQLENTIYITLEDTVSDISKLQITINLTNDGETIDLSPHLSLLNGDDSIELGINWGEGNASEVFNIPGEPISHVYQNGGQYMITIGTQTGFKWTGTTEPSTLKSAATSISVSTKKSPIKDIYKGFESFNNLVSISGDLFNNCTEITDFSDMFKECSSLEDIPENIFENNTNIESLNSTFYNCTSLRSIPDNLFDNCTNINNFESCFSGCSGIRDLLPELWITFENANGSHCFNYCNNATNYYDAYDNNWADDPEPDEIKPGTLLLTCDIIENNFVLDLTPHLSTVPENRSSSVKINWGDGSPEQEYQLNGSTEISHQYNSTDEYVVSITGFINWTGTREYYYSLAGVLTEVSWSGFNNPIKELGSNAFYHCERLRTISGSLFIGCQSPTGFESTFEGCESLQEIPEYLFITNSEAYSFKNCFAYCSSLRSIPAGLFDNCALVTHFSACFFNCPQIQSIPEGLFDNCTNAETFDSCFSYCTQLETIPEGLFNNCRNVTAFSYCFEGCSSITSKLPELWISHSTAEGVRCFNNCDKAPNFEDAFDAGWADEPVLPSKRKMILNIVSPEDGFVDFSYILGNDTNLPEYTEDATIDWGDGSEVVNITGNEYSNNKTKLQHTYSQGNKEYKISIRGNIKWSGCSESDNYIPANTRTSIISIELPNNNSPIQFITDSGFYGFTKLRLIPAGLLDNCTLVTNFRACFYRCTGLQAIPKGLFDKCINANNFIICFTYCVSLQSIPPGLFDNCTKVSTFQGCFSSCTKLQSIPNGLFDKCTQVTDFNGCFQSCSELQSIPTGLFNNCTKVTDFNFCFTRCSAVTSNLPTLWISHSTATHMQCFNYCNKAPNYEDAYNAKWANDPIPSKMILNIVSPSDGKVDFSRILGSDEALEYTEDATLDWGDGSAIVNIVGNELTNGVITKLQHTYSGKNTNYKITIRGKIKWNWDDISNYKTYESIKSIELPTSNSPIKFITPNGFENYGLQSIPVGLFDNCSNVKDLSYCFSGCSQLQSIPTGLFDRIAMFNSVTNFHSCFLNCTSLQSIPAGLFDKCTSATDFGECFSDCAKLQSIPNGLFDKCTKVTDFSSCFYSCSSITSSLPTLWTSHSMAAHNSCFNYCNKAPNYDDAYDAGWANTPEPEIPQMILNIVSPDNGAVNFTYVLCNDTKLAYTKNATIDWGDGSETEIIGDEYSYNKNKLFHAYSQGNKNYKITIKGKVRWDGDSSSNSIPFATRDSIISIELPTNNSPIKFISNYGFYEYTKLQTIPAGLFDRCPSVKDFQYCFEGCTSLQTIPNGLFDKCTLVTQFNRCFRNCESLRAIPAKLFDNNTKVTNFNACFYGCSSVTGALPELWNTHPAAVGWGITDCFTGCTKASNIATARSKGWAS